ncbi:type IV secretory system conjugative DNA transfer family protein [Albirhodobacter sp. R86504]|uniref:type IV secretory system conjugative DNA transfer family protein n=1 Tax=Albirhodobacter sp. R86504 TaxID=3093848 RepID=UPI00366CD622
MTEARAKSGLHLGWAAALDRRAAFGFRSSAELGKALKAEAEVILGPEDHALTFAPTGAGKGTTSIIPLLLSHEGPAVVFDPKGEAAHVTANWRRGLGHEVHIIDPFGVTGLPQARFNPLDLIDLARADAYDEARALAGCLIETDNDPRNAFWVNQSRQLIVAAMLQATANAPRSTRNAGTKAPRSARFDAVLQLCDAMRPGQNDWLRHSGVPEVARIAKLLDLGAPETIGGVLHFVEDAMETLQSAPVRAALGPSSFRLADLIEGRPMTLYFVLPPHMLRSHSRLVRLWFGAVMQAMARRRRAPQQPTLFVIDEAAQLGRLEVFVTLMTLMRGYGVQVASYWQDPAQLIRAYPDDWQSLRNNARLITAFGQTGPAALRDLERFLGQAEGALGAFAGVRLSQIEGHLMRAQTRDYRYDADLMARAAPNPYHSAAIGPIERPAAKAPRRKPVSKRSRKRAPAPNDTVSLEDTTKAAREALGEECRQVHEGLDALFPISPPRDPDDSPL